MTRDRLERLVASTALNGIDFVEVASPDQRTLRVHFVNTVSVAGTIAGASITGGETVRTVEVMDPVDAPGLWSSDAEGRQILTLTAEAPGDFSFYTLSLDSPKLDRFYDRALFSFKATCPSDLDCKQPEALCPPEEGPLPPIDYLAKDFRSFVKALSDFSSLRYPEWQERSEADFGVMFMEALSALGDDLSYVQDRVAAESSLETATQRRSIVRHARLVDYEPRPATSARALLRFTVSGGPIPSGAVVEAHSADGTAIEFETGTGLRDTTSYPADVRWNALSPYWWDDEERCLRAGAGEMWVLGHDLGLFEGQQILLDTQPDTPGDAPIRQVVRLAPSKPGRGDHAVEEEDPLFLTAGAPTPVTHIRWAPSDALVADHDLTKTVVAGNLVPATQGRRFVQSFAIEQAPATAPATPLALARTGPRPLDGETAPPVYMATLSPAPLGWLAPEDGGGAAIPEIALHQILPPPASETLEWSWRRRLLDAEPFENAFTVDRARYTPVARGPGAAAAHEYDSDEGDTVRFGDGVFGEVPDDEALFTATFRTTRGAAGNVAADTITRIDPASGLPASAVTNPFAATGGEDPEPDQQVRRLAPQAFRAVQYRAVRAPDYDAAARTLPWVSNAGTVFRWTGSWLTIFTTADPKGGSDLPIAEHAELVGLLNRYRLAGYEVYSPDPIHLSIDVRVRVCARPDVFRGDVEAELLDLLRPRRRDGTPGFFDPDRYTFGTPLERSALVAAIQRSYGVAGVVEVQYRRRGTMQTFADMPSVVSVRPCQIPRTLADPNRPETGSVHVVVEGGK